MIESLHVDASTERDDWVRQLQEDAARYRWLRAQEAVGCWPQVVDGLRRLVGDQLDATIDDAMRGDRPRHQTLRLN